MMDKTQNNVHEGKIERARMEVHDALEHLGKAMKLFQESKAFDHEAYQTQIDQSKQKRVLAATGDYMSRKPKVKHGR